MLEQWRKESNIKKTADIIGIFIILAGIAVSIFMNCVGRSLWLDEAYLVSSLKNRSLWTLTATPLDYIQSAPVIYLYIVKVCMLLFGDTEGVLRLFSIISFVLTIFLTWYVAKYLFRCRYAVLCAAFVANIDFLLRYSNVLKPYVSECVWVLLVLAVYAAYQEEKLSWWGMMLLYMVFIWAANPVCFFIGGVLTCEFLYGIFQKNYKKMLKSIVSGIGIGCSFIVYYLYWLRSAATDDFMQKYWVNDRFPFFPASREDIALGWKLIRRMVATSNEELRFLVIALIVGAFVIGMKEKNKYSQVILIGFILALFASSLYMFPVADRLWCFSYPIYAILSFYFIDAMLLKEGERRAEIFAVFLMGLMIITNSGIQTYRHADNVYWEGNEVNPLLSYVQEHVTEDEKVYVFYNSIPVVTYKNGYGINKIGNVAADNIIWGTSVIADTDLNTILAAGKCYLITSQADDETIGDLLTHLTENGSLETVVDAYGTKLYYFSR